MLENQTENDMATEFIRGYWAGMQVVALPSASVCMHLLVVSGECGSGQEQKEAAIFLGGVGACIIRGRKGSIPPFLPKGR